mmetsp:Transcript_17785/g.59987  ORF Transcript_17785/g.59987 Transcript_17785/m.59987 type:complete len:243 (+) Transcript_17785:4464-5192(+)
MRHGPTRAGARERRGAVPGHLQASDGPLRFLGRLARLQRPVRCGAAGAVQRDGVVIRQADCDPRAARRQGSALDQFLRPAAVRRRAGGFAFGQDGRHLRRPGQRHALHLHPFKGDGPDGAFAEAGEAKGLPGPAGRRLAGPGPGPDGRGFSWQGRCVGRLGLAAELHARKVVDAQFRADGFQARRGPRHERGHFPSVSHVVAGGVLPRQRAAKRRQDDQRAAKGHPRESVEVVSEPGPAGRL